MKIKDQVITLEQAKRLKELGVKSPALLYHLQMFVNTVEKWMIVPEFKHEYGDYVKDDFIDTAMSGMSKNEYYPAYTVAELGEMLPTSYDSMRLHEGWRVYDDDDNDGTGKDEIFNTEAQARGALLIHLIEMGIINPLTAK